MCTHVRVWWCHFHGGHVSKEESICFQISQQVQISWGMERTEVRESQTSSQKFLKSPCDFLKIASKIGY